MNPLLTVKNMCAGYGQGHVIQDINMEIIEGSVTALLGSNGAGKTTTLRALTRMINMSGELHFGGQRIDTLVTEEIVRLGVAHVPDGRGTFTGLTTEENLRLGAYSRHDKSSQQQDLEKMYGYFPKLRERKLQQAGTLSGGEQQMLAIARALMNRPQLLLLDEPSMGLSPRYRQEVFQILADLRDTGLGILLVEQNVRSALRLAHRAHVLSQGVFTASGAASDLANDPAVLAGYLGHGKLTAKT